jgi:hypothetical protein
MRALILFLGLSALAGCSGDPEPEVTENPVWGPQVQALREAQEVGKFAEEQQMITEEAMRNLGIAPDQLHEDR